MRAVGYGDAIRRLRTAQGWDQPTLAARAHVSLDTIVRAEQSGNITIYKLHQIAEALSVETPVLFCGDAPPAPPPTVWARLTAEQRAYLERVAARLLREAGPRADD